MLSILSAKRRITVELICASMIIVLGLGSVAVRGPGVVAPEDSLLDTEAGIVEESPAVEAAEDRSAGRPQETAEPRADLTAAELDLLARLIRAEAQGEPYPGKVAVAAVVLNRMESRLFPNTVRGVIYERRQFEPVDNGAINRKADAVSLKAAQDALRGDDPSRGALYFFNPAKTRNRFLGARRVTAIIGRHRFTL